MSAALVPQFIETATQLVGAAGVVREFEPDASAIVASAIEGDTADAGELDVEPTVLPWPIDIRLDTVYEVASRPLLPGEVGCANHG